MQTEKQSNRRYLFFSGLVAVVSVLALILLAVLTTLSLKKNSVNARSDSPRVYHVGGKKREQTRVTIAIAPVITSRNSYPAWSELASFLKDALGISVSLLQRRTYAEINELIEKSEADFALLCSGPYVQLRQRGLVRLLVVPRVRGAVVYHSLIIVRADLNARAFKDLRGRSFAFSDPLSNSGKTYPSFLVHQLTGGKTTTRQFFSNTIITNGHDRSILSVAGGVVDAAAVDNLVFDDMKSRRPELFARLRVILKSPPFGINPFIVRSGVDPSLAKRIQRVLLTMNENSNGRAILRKLGIDRFQIGSPEAYRSIEKMQTALLE